MQAIEQLRHEIINRVIGIEGGYVNDSRDSGGETKWGITLATARAHGYNVRTLTTEQAFDIYERSYWHKLNLDGVASLSPAVAEELFDSGVNLGTARAAEWLQRSLNVLNNNGSHWRDVAVDGDLGENTLSAIDAFFRKRGSRAEGVLLNMLNGLQSTFYLELAERRPKDEAFQYGWQSTRVDRVDDVAVQSPQQLFATDTIPTAQYQGGVQLHEPAFAGHPKYAEPVAAPAPPVAPRWAVLDWLPGMKTHLLAAAGVAVSAAELMGYSIPAPVYGILASLGVSTAYRGFQRSRV